MRLTLFIVIVSLCLFGCSTTMQLVEFKSGEVAEAFIDANKGEIRVYLPDGEILKGPYSTITNPRFSIGAGVGGYGGTRVYPSVSLDPGSKLYALLSSQDASSTLVMEIIADQSKFTGKGRGEARTNDGRVFKIVL